MTDATKTRPIYIVAPKKSEAGTPIVRRLVRARNKGHVRQHLLSEYGITLASQDDLIKTVGEGVAVEQARDVDDDDKDSSRTPAAG